MLSSRIKRPFRVVLLAVCPAILGCPLLWRGDGYWTETFGGDENDYGYSVCLAADGGYVIAGSTASYDANYLDACLLKVDERGNEVWHQVFGENSVDAANCVVPTADGGYIFAGYIHFSGGGGLNTNMYVVKTNAVGEAEWTRRYGRTDVTEWSTSDAAHCIRQTTDGGYLIAGTGSPTDNYPDMYIVKTNAQGDEEWSKRFGGVHTACAYWAEQTCDGGYIIAGTISLNSGEIYLVKMDAAGNREWERTFGGYNYPYKAYSVVPTTDGGYILAGSAGLVNDAYILKTDAQGNEEWSQTSDSECPLDVGCAYSVLQTSDGGYVFAGETESLVDYSDDMYLVKLDAQGNTIWSRTYGDIATDVAHQVVQTPNGGFLLVGHSQYGLNDDYKIRLVRVNSEGQ